MGVVSGRPIGDDPGPNSKDKITHSSYKLGRLLGDSYPFMVLFSAAFALSL